MENATKALLIAGSVLIAILLIAVGVRIFNSTSGTTEATKTTMDATEVAMFNNKFIPYIGKNKSKSDILALIGVVAANNSSNSSHKVNMNLYRKGMTGSTSGNINELLNYANQYYTSEGKEYTINVELYTKGYISTLSIKNF